MLRRCGGLWRKSWNYWFRYFLHWEGVLVLKGLIFVSVHIWIVQWSWKDWLWITLTLARYGGLAGTDFWHFSLWEGLVVLKELILNNLYFERLWQSWKEWFWIISTLGECDGPVRTDFGQFLLWEVVVVLEGLFSVIFTLRGCGDHESTDLR